jgi:hypothetical protein
MSVMIITVVLCLIGIVAADPASSFNPCPTAATGYQLGPTGRYYYYVNTVGGNSVSAFSCSSPEPKATFAILDNPVDLAWMARILSGISGVKNGAALYIGLKQNSVTFEPDYNWTWYNGEIFHSTPFDGRPFQLNPNGTFMDFTNGPVDTSFTQSCAEMNRAGSILENTNCGKSDGVICSLPGEIFQAIYFCIF